MSSLGFEKTIKSTMVLAEEKVTQVLQQKGFGILSRIDFACKMKEKLDKDVRPTVILGACNPALAYEAYSQDKNMLLLVPCNVTLEQISDSEISIRMIRPSVMLKALEKANLVEMAKQADDILETVIQGLKNRLKHRFWILPLLAFSLTTKLFAATPEDFAKYPAVAQTVGQTLKCKELDYDSYHKVEKVKTNIIRSNHDRSHPNFAGKYLLLRNDFLFETAWFVADCETGKFIKEILSTDHKDPKAEFNVNSALFSIWSEHKDSNIPPEQHVFQNEKWMRVEVATVATPAVIKTNPIAITSPTPIPVTTDLFSKFPASVNSSAPCKEPDFNSFYRAQNAKKHLMAITPDLSHANFGGHYLLLKGETIFQSYWLIADCLTGKFFPEMITGGGAFNKESRLLKIYSSGSFPTYFAWIEDEAQWIQVRDPDQGNKQTIKNSMHGKSALTLFDAIPNKDKSTTVRFENLKCIADHCELDLGKEKAAPVSPDAFPALSSLLQTWSSDLSIKSGRCTKEAKSAQCEVEN